MGREILAVRRMAAEFSDVFRAVGRRHGYFEDLSLATSNSPVAVPVLWCTLELRHVPLSSPLISEVE